MKRGPLSGWMGDSPILKFRVDAHVPASQGSGIRVKGETAKTNNFRLVSVKHGGRHTHALPLRVTRFLFGSDPTSRICRVLKQTNT